MDEWRPKWMNGNKMNGCWVVICVDHELMSERKLNTPEIECSWNVINISPSQKKSMSSTTACTVDKVHKDHKKSNNWKGWILTVRHLLGWWGWLNWIHFKKQNPSQGYQYLLWYPTLRECSLICWRNNHFYLAQIAHREISNCQKYVCILFEVVIMNKRQCC